MKELTKLQKKMLADVPADWKRCPHIGTRKVMAELVKLGLVETRPFSKIPKEEVARRTRYKLKVPLEWRRK